MKNQLNYSIFKISIFFLFLIFIDQLSKYLIRLKSGFYICNLGISWGISVPTYLFFTLWTIIMLLLLFFLLKSLKISNFQSQKFFFVAILAGAVSNMTDRLIFGCVVDFIDLKFWPVFNLADIFIVLGVILLLVNRKKI